MSIDKDGNKKNRFGMIMAVYLLGIFMGALDTGIVTPARTVIQTALNVNDNTGVWMITIYTLAYAASIPVMGKLADRAGRKYVYIISISLFGAGSLFCGLSQGFGSFTILLIARAVQAIGGGGIMPVATAEFGTTFPEEKRGMALGLVGGVYGVANIFGASVGSAILDLFGNNEWQFIFYVNVPITVFIIIAGVFALPNNTSKSVKRIDGLGIMVLVVMILALMYGLRNIDFFDFIDTLTATDVYPFLIVFCVLLPVFIIVEKRAEDPVMNLSYFSNRSILITLIVSVMTGVILMGLIFVPQLCENCMEVRSGSGGYFVIILGVFAGMGAPLSGRMTDKIGPRLVLCIGFAASIAGSLFLIFVTTVHPGWASVIISLILIGTGIGFTMGAPLNYMMLDNTAESESNSALATLSLVRSIGTVIAPAIMVGFISHAGMQVQGDVMDLLPDKISVPQLPYAQELTKAMKEQGIKGMPDLSNMTTVKIDMNDSSSDYKVPDKLLDKMKNSDVTTIVHNTKYFSKAMFDQMVPDIEKQILSGIDKGISGMQDGLDKIDKNISGLNDGIDGISKGITGMKSALAKQDASLAKMKKTRSGLQKGAAGIQKGLAVQKMMRGQLSAAQAVLAKMPADPSRSLADQLPAEMKKSLAPPVISLLEKMRSIGQLNGVISGFDSNIKTMTGKYSSMEAAVRKMNRGISGLSSGRAQVAAKLDTAISQKAKMQQAVSGIKKGRTSLQDDIRKMNVMKAAVPGTFRKAETDYLDSIDSRSDIVETTFQKTLNNGFRQVYMTVAIASAAGIILLMFYRKRRTDE